MLLVLLYMYVFDGLLWGMMRLNKLFIGHFNGYDDVAKCIICTFFMKLTGIKYIIILQKTYNALFSMKKNYTLNQKNLKNFLIQQKFELRISVGEIFVPVSMHSFVFKR